ncbi:MAG: glycosyltransferase [Gammaproteobacteria bacterium]|nr:glycosyltransferase [Gammaproteobacteria bacterium]
MKNAVWVTWEDQRRNKSLSKELGVELHQLNLNAHRLVRYPLLFIKTISIFLKRRPEIIFSQNPSIILSLISVIYGQITGKKVIVDAHNAGVYPFEGSKPWATKMAHFLFRKAFLTIVTNNSLKLYVEECGGQAFILPDPFPIITSSRSKVSLQGKTNYLLICTWAIDEPYEEVIKAFSQLPSDMHLYITGNSRGKESNLSVQMPDNITLTGFISNDEFDSLLTSCDVVIDLTTREDCLVCGAYEAIAAGKPLILSETKALREYFTNSAIYTKNYSEDIAEAIKMIDANLGEAENNVKDYYRNQVNSWNEMKNQLIDNIGLAK